MSYITSLVNSTSGTFGALASCDTLTYRINTQYLVSVLLMFSGLGSSIRLCVCITFCKYSQIEKNDDLFGTFSLCRLYCARVHMTAIFVIKVIRLS